MTGVLVVDDSRFMRTVVAGILTDHGYEVGTASDGREAVELVEALDPDVVTMDVEMPGMDGIEATERIMTRCPTPVVMVSAHTETGADATLQALARGAVDFVPKPGTDDDLDVEALTADLIATIEPASSTEVQAIDPDLMPGRRRESMGANRAGSAGPGGTRDPRNRGWTATDPDRGPGDEGQGRGEEEGEGEVAVDPDYDPVEQPTVVFGASAGGPRVLESVLSRLPTAIDARVLIVQHMPASFTGRFADHLDDVSSYAVSEATEGTVVGGGDAVVASGDHHLRIGPVGEDGLLCQLDQSDRRHSVRPAIDITMTSAAERVPPPLVGVILTGMGRDGAAGIEAIDAAGGTTIVQDRESSPVPGMPRHAIETGRVDHIVPPEDIPETICAAVTGNTRPEEAHA